VNIGDLYYVPQSVLLMQYEGSNDAPVCYYMTERPIKVVIVDKNDDGTTIVFYNGQKWCVKGKNLYLLEEKCPL
tara:strand:- start:512 stop:733 length:222 start_codon:yes stop_codon:yes gene_type:complete